MEIAMKYELGRIRLSVVILYLLANGCALTSLAIAADLPKEIERLSKDHPRAERLDAIDRLRHESESSGSEKAIVGLSGCAKDDDPEIRRRSLNALTMIAVD